MMQREPILLQTSALATTAREAGFRINFPEPDPRASRIIALDARAEQVVRDLAGQQWRGSRFLTRVDSIPQSEGGSADAVLVTAEGTESSLAVEVGGADVVIMVATADAEPSVGAMVGDLCAAEGVMSAALVIDGDHVERAVAALRPNAMVLLILKDEHDIPDLLTALRA